MVSKHSQQPSKKTIFLPKNAVKSHDLPQVCEDCVKVKLSSHTKQKAFWRKILEDKKWSQQDFISIREVPQQEQRQ